MNPMEQIWEELKEKHFANRFFKTLDKATNQLCFGINNLKAETIVSITGRRWILSTGWLNNGINEQLRAWTNDRNDTAKYVDRHFTAEDARGRLKHLYPKL